MVLPSRRFCDEPPPLKRENMLTQGIWPDLDQSCNNEPSNSMEEREMIKCWRLAVATSKSSMQSLPSTAWDGKSNYWLLHAQVNVWNVPLGSAAARYNCNHQFLIKDMSVGSLVQCWRTRTPLPPPTITSRNISDILCIWFTILVTVSSCRVPSSWLLLPPPPPSPLLPLPVWWMEADRYERNAWVSVRVLQVVVVFCLPPPLHHPLSPPWAGPSGFQRSDSNGRFEKSTKSY